MKWTIENIPDLTNKVAIVTGANSGIGFATSHALSSKGARVILACRTLENGQQAIEKIKKQEPESELETMKLDLADLKSVEKFSNEFKSKYNKLNILINNAGVMKTPYQLTTDGFELQFATNHLGHFALTGRLLSLIKNTPKSRIVTLSSGGHKFAKMDFSNLQGEKKYNAQGAYSQSKLANLLFTYELQRRLEKANLETIAVAAHPGWTVTKLQKHWLLLRLLNPIIGQKPDKGALPTLYAATASEVKGGDYYGPSGIQELRGYPKKVKSSKLSYDESLAKQLWEISEELTGVKYFF